MIRFLILGLIMISCYTLSAQSVLYDPVSARVFNVEKYSGYNGSPFLLGETWLAGTATVYNGTYKGLELKLDAYNNTLFFKKDDQPFEFKDDVLRFVLMPQQADSSTWMHFKKGLEGAGLKSSQYVQVLAEGKFSLYKSELKSLSDVNQINQGVVKTFTTATRYYVSKNGEMQLIKTGKKDILELLNDKADKVQAYINEQKISFKKDGDLAKLFKYYNTL